MTRSRPVSTDAALRDLIAEALRPGHFFVGGTLALEWAPPAQETIFWEVFQGRLLDAPLTRARRTFEAWNVFLVEAGARAAEPVLSVKFDAEAGQVHVVRAVHCYAWEGYDAGGNVILSRETRKWVRELVGTLHLDRCADLDALRDELVCRLFHAVVGTSRLPLTSVEAPLPAFAFGELAYFYRGRTEAPRPSRTWRELVEASREGRLNWLERAKLLETLLHATPAEELGTAADLLGGSAVYLLLTLFNEVSLSPYTDLVDKALAFLHALEKREHISTAEAADCLGRLLRQLGRHLTAYDLVTFHHRGANYPDALLLDALLKAYLALARREPNLFNEEPGARLRRRALRQGWLLRRRYEGHLVPDAPTSQGENLRVLPAPHVRVPEEQILQPLRRTRQLFAGDPLDGHLGDDTAALLRQSLADLRHPAELRELGTALFLDRPLGAGKAPLEPDATPLLSYVAFSRTLAARRLRYLGRELRLIDAAAEEALRKGLEQLQVAGVPLERIPVQPRPGVVSLADARQVAEDFVFLQTTASSAARFLALFDWQRFGLDFLGPVLILGAPEARLTIHDARLRPRLELGYELSRGYESRGGVELPAGGLQVLRIWDDSGGEVRPEYCRLRLSKGC